ncbi:MAG: hypothetical protein BWY72_01630 [Bacteroidetes bacterium ADurb.Bin416]|nr:MAG: hypothetical protein BWY72_01630 [Bacteroidetes bacterium ADurb.Bin416]
MARPASLARWLSGRTPMERMTMSVVMVLDEFMVTTSLSLGRLKEATPDLR